MDTASRTSWQGSGSVYELTWVGQTWLLRFDSARPGLSRSHGGFGVVLALDGLASIGRHDVHAFHERNLTSVELSRSRLQATYRPSDWGGMEVRASWGLGPDGEDLNLEVQVSASSVGELRAVEVFVGSCPGWNEDRTTGRSEYLVQPRHRRAAAMTYDGREPTELLHHLTTGPVPPQGTTGPGPILLESGWDDFPARLLELVHPDDLSRRIVTRVRSVECPSGLVVATRTGLFGHDLEKGVVIRGRLRGRWIASSASSDESVTAREFARFLDEALPLGT